jgi:esterase
MTDSSASQSGPVSNTVARDRTLMLNGLRFHYREWGRADAAPLVLLHGFTSNARHWDTLAQAMAGGHRVLALDQRGHGETDWAPDGDYMAARVNEDFTAFIDSLGLGRFAVVGFSFGGHAAYTYAAENPDRLDRLVLVESAVPPNTPELRTFMQALMGLPEVFNNTEEAVDVFKAARLAAYAPEDELRHWVVTGLKQRPEGGWTWRLDPAFRVPAPPGRARLVQSADAMWSLLPSVGCPTQRVRGAETVAFPLELAEQMAGVMPDAHVASIPHAGHWATLDNPGGFVQVVRDFLTQPWSSTRGPM